MSKKQGVSLTGFYFKKFNRVMFCSICAFLISFYSIAFCKEAYSTDQQKINSAIEIIKSYGFEKNIAILLGDNYTHKPVSIIFKDLSEVNFSYSKFYAITATENNGDLFILINNNLRNSDAKALACLILHESNHCKKNVADSVEEEAVAHTQETMLYLRILSDDEELQYKTDDRLVARLNKLKKIYDDAIKAYITSNTSYVNYLKIKE